jgi:hypothetical protein
MLTWSRYRWSWRFIWASWLAGFIVPFCIMLYYTYRSSVDWKGIATKLCVKTVTGSVKVTPELEPLLVAFTTVTISGLYLHQIQLSIESLP